MALVFGIFSPYVILKWVVKDWSVFTADMKRSSLGLFEPCFGLSVATGQCDFIVFFYLNKIL